MHSFDYAIVRVVPRVDRGEFINAGAIVFCKTLTYLAAAVALDTERLSALAPHADVEEIAAALALVPRLAAGEPSAGPVAQLSPAERFHWLVAPRSTITQTSPVHSGLCADPALELERLMRTCVRP